MSIRSANVWAADRSALAPFFEDETHREVLEETTTPGHEGRYRGGYEGAFADAMAALGPFESAPRLTVAVSGGADSMALVRLADHWARKVGGSVLALTVDHGLRPESADEAAQVADWMGVAGIPHRILAWRPEEPASQEAAREARYALLEAAAAEAGSLHLLTAHHRDDQLETVALRAEIGEGLVGLSGMPAIRELERCRLLRPLLGFPRSALREVCGDLGQDWIDDPSNRMERFARVRVRQHLSQAEDMCEELGRMAGWAAVRRRRLEAAMTDLALPVRFDDLGGATIDREALRDRAERLPPDLAMSAPCLLVARLLATLGGRHHGPALRAANAVSDGILGDGPVGYTLGGCRVTGGGRTITLRREWGRAERRLVEPGETISGWDGRFDLAVPDRDALRGLAEDEPLIIGPLGRAAPRFTPKGPLRSLAAASPALWAGSTLVAVSSAVSSGGAARANPARQNERGSGKVATMDALFRPRRPLADAPFAACTIVASGPARII